MTYTDVLDNSIKTGDTVLYGAARWGGRIELSKATVDSVIPLIDHPDNVVVVRDTGVN